MITIYIPGLAQKNYEYRRGDSQIIHDDKGCAIVIDGGEADLSSKLIGYCRNKKIKNVTYILTHWHIDHDVGMKTFLDVSGICVDRIYCPPPSELKGLQESGVSEDYNRANRRISLAKSLGKPIVYPKSGSDTEIKVGEIRCRIWRRAANRGDKNDYEVNNTSLCTYFPDLYYLTTGDTINSFDIYLSSHKDTVKVFKVPHHGNACTDSPCQKLKGYGAQLCWYNDWEPRGTAIGGTGFSRWGAGYTKKYFTTIRTDSDIIMTAANHTLKIQKGSSIWTYQIPYDGKGGEGWYQGEKGWWYQFADGSYAVGWNNLYKDGEKQWFYFSENGIMLTGWYFDKGFQKWYYLDPINGAMQKGKAINVDGYWYYLDGYGQMITGWHEPGDGYKRYLEPDSGKNQGHMYVACKATIDGKQYTFDGYGRASDASGRPQIIRNDGFKGYNVSKRTEPIKYIVVHYTGNDGATAAENVSYFNKADRQASADYFVDFSGVVCEYNPDVDVQYSWHCGGGKVSSQGGSYYGLCTNKNSIGIEICTKKSGAEWKFSELALDAAATLVRWLMKQYDVPIDHVIRHYDVTGKQCPNVKNWLSPDSAWIAWKSRLTDDVPALPYRVRKTWEDAKSQIGAFNSLDNAKTMAAKNTGYHVYDANGKEII